jgi:hypothetical protein
VAKSGWARKHWTATSDGVKTFVKAQNKFKLNVLEPLKLTRDKNQFMEAIGSICENSKSFSVLSQALKRGCPIRKDKALHTPDVQDYKFDVKFLWWKLFTITLPVRLVYPKVDRATRSKAFEAYAEQNNGIATTAPVLPDVAVGSAGGTYTDAEQLKANRKFLEDCYKTGINATDATLVRAKEHEFITNTFEPNLQPSVKAALDARRAQMACVH